jgi:hypothetical protein
MLAVAAVLGVAGCGGGGGSTQTDSASLKALLPPAQKLGPLRIERTFAWDNPTDFIVQGTVLPALTKPTDAIAKMAGFESAAGEALLPKGATGGPPVLIDAAAFGSADDATASQDYLHSQDLQQPCAASCSVNPTNLKIPNVPGATAVHQVPINAHAPGSFEAYSAEFTIGSNLFYATASGNPGDIPPQVFERGVAAFYKQASQSSA